MILAMGVAFVVTLLATPAVRAAAGRLGLVDHPGHRSSHQQPTPRAGGVALLAGVAVGLAASGGIPTSDPALLALLVGATLVALVGLADDRFDLPAFPRLAVHALAAGLVVWFTGGLERLPLPAPLDAPVGPLLGTALAVIWIVGVVNLYNFMDGIDGLAALQAVVTAGALALALSRGAPGASLVAAGLAGAAGAFLYYNWAPASVFLGDVGSGVVGYTLASLPLLATGGEGASAVVLVGASLFLFLADTTTCLLGRVARGERWFEAHRRHLYQRWVATGAGHGRVAGWLGLGTALTTAAALGGWQTGEAVWYWISLALGCALFAAEWAVVRRREARVADTGAAENGAR